MLLSIALNFRILNITGILVDEKTFNRVIPMTFWSSQDKKYLSHYRFA